MSIFGWLFGKPVFNLPKSEYEPLWRKETPIDIDVSDDTLVLTHQQTIERKGISIVLDAEVRFRVPKRSNFAEIELVNIDLIDKEQERFSLRCKQPRKFLLFL